LGFEFCAGHVRAFMENNIIWSFW